MNILHVSPILLLNNVNIAYGTEQLYKNLDLVTHFVIEDGYVRII